jgi:hypothetical protein
LNKALNRVTGDIVGWLNADDYYAPNIFSNVAGMFAENPDTHFVFGNTVFIDEHGEVVVHKRPRSRITWPVLLRWWNTRQLHQPSIFFSKHLLNEVGAFSTTLHFSIDYEYWLRAHSRFDFHFLNQTLSYVRVRDEAKSSYNSPDLYRSHQIVTQPYLKYLSPVQKISYAINLRFFLATANLRAKAKLGSRVRRLFGKK